MAYALRYRVHDKSKEDLQALARGAARKVSRLSGVREKATAEDEEILARIEGLVPFVDTVTDHLKQQGEERADDGGSAWLDTPYPAPCCLMVPSLACCQKSLCYQLVLLPLQSCVGLLLGYGMAQAGSSATPFTHCTTFLRCDAAMVHAANYGAGC